MPDWFALFALIILLSLFILTVAVFILCSELLTDAIVQTGYPPIKRIIFAYKFREGPYKNCGQLFKEARCVGPKLSCIAVFYGDHKTVKHTVIC